MRTLASLLVCVLCSSALGQSNEARRQCNLGVRHYNKGEYDAAIAHLNEAIRLAPRWTSAYKLRGYTWATKEEHNKAISDYTEAIRLDQKDGWTYANRGYSWAEKGEYDIAIADYNEAIRLNPRNAIAYTSRGCTWDDKGEYDKALADYNEAIRLDPRHDWAYNNRAWQMATCPVAKYRDGAKAVKDATKACELSDWKEAYFIATLAAAYAENGDFDEAVKWLKKAMEMTPNELVEVRKDMLTLFQSGKPYRDEPKKE
jgi:tetratricopeptide (TPR) repeat protein